MKAVVVTSSSHVVIAVRRQQTVEIAIVPQGDARNFTNRNEQCFAGGHITSYSGEWSYMHSTIVP